MNTNKTIEFLKLRKFSC